MPRRLSFVPKGFDCAKEALICAKEALICAKKALIMPRRLSFVHSHTVI